MKKKDIMGALVKGATIVVYSPIDPIYGVWTIEYSPVKKGYLKEYLGASNWQYCPVCGTRHGQGEKTCGCGNVQVLMDLDDVFNEILALKKQGLVVSVTES